MVGTFIKFDYKRLKSIWNSRQRGCLSMSRWGPLAGKGGNKLEGQKYFQTGCIQKIFEEVEPKIFSTRLRSNEATDCHYQGVLGSFSQATWRCPVFRWRSRMEDILTSSSMVIKVLTKSLLQISDTGTYICFAPDHPPSPGSQVSMYLAVTKSG